MFCRYSVLTSGKKKKTYRGPPRGQRLFHGRIYPAWLHVLERIEVRFWVDRVGDSTAAHIRYMYGSKCENKTRKGTFRLKQKQSLDFNRGLQIMLYLLAEKWILTAKLHTTALRTLYLYTPSQKFNTIRVSVLRDVTKMWKKINHIKGVKNIFLPHNNPKSYQKKKIIIAPWIIKWSGSKQVRFFHFK